MRSLIREFRNTTVIIDHRVRQLRGTPGENAVVVKWSRFENTVMNLSAIRASEICAHRDIAPVIRQFTDARGRADVSWPGVQRRSRVAAAQVAM
jgi:hypothetical protein